MAMRKPRKNPPLPPDTRTPPSPASPPLLLPPRRPPRCPCVESRRRAAGFRVRWGLRDSSGCGWLTTRET